MIHRRQRRFMWLLKPVAVTLLLCSVFGIVWLRSSVVSLKYRLSALEQRKKELMKETKMLMAEKAGLMSVERFETIAQNGSGFAFPDRVKVVFVKSGDDKKPLKTSLSAGEADISGGMRKW